MEAKIPARIGLSPPIVKFGLVWPKLADFVAIGPKFERKKTFLKHVQLYHSRILLDYLTKIEADHKACRSTAKSCSDIKTCYPQKVFSQTYSYSICSARRARGGRARRNHLLMTLD
jgi:hypothetical protein